MTSSIKLDISALPVSSEGSDSLMLMIDTCVSDKVLNNEAYPVATLDRLRGFHNHNGPKFRISLLFIYTGYYYIKWS